METSHTSLLSAVRSLSARTALLDPGHLDHVEGRLAGVANRMAHLQDRKAVLQDQEKAAKCAIFSH